MKQTFTLFRVFGYLIKKGAKIIEHRIQKLLYFVKTF